MDGHVPDEPEGDLCRCGFPPSSRHAGILPNAQREENSNRTTYTVAEPSRYGCTTVQEIPLGTGGYRLQKPGPDHTGTNHSCLVRKAATVRNTQVTLSGKTPMELAMGRKPRDLLDPPSKNSEQLTSTPTKKDLLNEEIQQLAMQTHLEVQQREDFRRDLAERMKFVPPDLRAGEYVFYWQEDPSKIQQGRKSGK